MPAEAGIPIVTKDQIVTNLKSKYDQLRNRRMMYEDRWQESTDMALPRISDFTRSRPGQDKIRSIKSYDGTARSALRLASDGYQGWMVPKNSPWFKIDLQNRKLMELPGVREWLQECEEIVYSELARSNFYEQIGEVIDTGLCIGTAGLHVDRDHDRDVEVFRTYHPKELYIAEDNHGRVGTVVREFWMTGVQLLEEFEKDGAVPNDVIENIKVDPFESHKVLHFVFKREKRIWGRVDSKNKPIASVYLLEAKQTILRESGFDLMREVVWRYRTNTDEEYGTSPASDSLVDILRINGMARSLMILAQRAAEPPIMYPGEYSDEIDLEPNGMNPYTDPARKIIPLDLAGNYPVTKDQEAMIAQTIKENFHVDFFLMIANSLRTKTAYEVSEIASEKAAIMGTIIGRMEGELLDPILDVVWEDLKEAGKLPVPPLALLAHAGTNLKFDYVGPLAQLQKQHHGNQTLTQMIAQIMPILQINPQASDLVDWDQLVKETLTNAGIDQRIIRSDQDVQKIRAERVKQQMQQKVLEQIQTLGKAAPGLNQPVNPNSPAAAMLGGPGAISAKVA